MLLLLQVAALAQSDSESAVRIDANPAPAYTPGDVAAIDVRIRLEGPTADLTSAVAFLNVVELDEERRYPQRAHVLFVDASEEPPLFRRVWSVAELVEGRGSRISFSFRRDAAPGTYAFVIQVFAGENRDPHRVRIEDRIALKSYRFVVQQ